MEGESIKEIFLLRHGEIDRPDPKTLAGGSDYPLSEKGAEQARYLLKMMSDKEIEIIYCSDLSRSIQTAEIIAQGRTPIKAAHGLREIHLGRWEGLTKYEIQKKYPGQWELRGRDFGSLRPQGGENFQDLANRVIPEFREILTAPQRIVVIVGHAAVNRTIIGWILNISFQDIFRFRQDYGAMNIIEAHKGGCCVKLLNLVHKIPPSESMK